MFGCVVGFVLGAGLPVEIELLGGDTIAKPMNAHVKRFGAFHTNLGAEDTECCCVVSFEGMSGRGLRVSHLGEGGDDWDCSLGV